MVTQRREPVDFLQIVTRNLLVLEDGRIEGDLTVLGSLTASGGVIGFGFTAGSVLFGNSSGNIGEDNANLFWDDTLNRLGIGTITPGESLEVAGQVELQNYLHFNTKSVPADPALEEARFFLQTTDANNNDLARRSRLPARSPL